jgi:PAS domain S-box-containing protein
LFVARAVHPTGTYIGPGRLDAVERLYAYRTLREAPLVVTVGVATQDILAEANSRRRGYYASAAAVTGVIATFAALLSVAFVRRKQVFDELLASQTRLQALFEHSNDSILLADDATSLIEANPSACALLGYSRTELLRLRLNDIMPHGTEAAVAEQWQRFLAIGRGSGEMRARHRDGRILDIDYAAVANIEPGVHLSIFRDVTARKALERHALRAQRMESLGTLAGGIAHDLNNALAPILMSIAVLREDEADPMKQELLDTIGESAQRGADMVRQVLSFARGIEGRRMSVAVDRVIRDVEKIANDTFFKATVVRVRMAPDLPTIVGDPTQLHQVLLNLCVNARDAMPNGGSLTITADTATVDDQFISMEPEARLGRYLVIGVTDTGTGIPANVVDRIFEPFFTTKDLGEGTGLGLSTSLAIVRGHGGFIRVRSEPGRGTTFQVYLPIRENQEEPAHAAAAEPLPRGHHELVLVIDDEAAVRAVTRQTLEAFGYRVITAADGTSGVATYASHLSDVAVVITDMMMPGLDGAQTMLTLRAITPNVRLIAVSGLADDARVAGALGAGAQRVLPKPFTAEMLLRALHEVLHL